MSARRLLTGATLVTPDGVEPNSTLLIENGRIAALGSSPESLSGSFETIDVTGCHLLPGLIDLHTDTLEKEITPRPSADFPVEVAIQELDRKLIACGITTVYHSLHFGYEEAELANRSRFTRREIVGAVRAMAASSTLAKTRIHARYEIVGQGPAAKDTVCALLEEGVIDLLSFMDHTPGQGQYTRSLFLERQAKQGLSQEAALKLLEQKQNRPRLSPDELAAVAQLATSLAVPLASHDDDTVEKVKRMIDLGVTICEFPVTLAAAQAAIDARQFVLGGASNVLRGGSLTGNLNVTEAIRARAINGLCSDYYPPAMLHAVFKLEREGVLPLHEAVNTATLIPARAAGIADETGSLSVGKEADLLVVRLERSMPQVLQAYVTGECVHTAGREAARRPADNRRRPARVTAAQLA